jgi:omega-hydroxy-beta-dihydromenaquinone-9 sulfotransferase
MTVSPDDAPSAQPADEREATGPSAVRPAALERLPTEPEAVFIVGVSRSGTTLMRRILGRHSRIAIADENHYMGHLVPGQGVRHVVRKAGDLADDANVRRLVELLYSDGFRRGSRLRDVSPFWQALPDEVPREELERRLLDADRSESGVFLAILQAVAEHRGKAIPGEKTPAHIRFAAELLAWYPTARVVHMVRDPRGIYVSELKRRRERPESVPYRWLVHVPLLLRLFVVGETVWAWADSVGTYRELRRRFPDRYRAVRFEDLVADPRGELIPLCRFLGVKFESGMLRQKVVSRGARQGETGFDAGAADRWQEHILPWERRSIETLLGRRLEQLGYRRA